MLDIIVSTGLVSNMTTQMPNYYYNASLAHCVYYGSTVTKKGHQHLHGEIVALGILCLLTYDQQFEVRDRIMEFNDKMGFRYASTMWKSAKMNLKLWQTKL